ncbi:uncharacterized protein SAPINGB_P004362 [Magnusiomyces paraingens]|uniref:Uncharacterized protein n=1 Tax=Magnusiomyces paraingens TaxID=2606893 RepID=A0A5E8BZH4_9ASCO|nr:uncharacterized protein SAPINGB_P004362 [Saprochaete ingens]VVT54987.1 unnamed protein product [Saprochaete ingens]
MVGFGRGGYGNSTPDIDSTTQNTTDPSLQVFSAPSQTIRTGRGGFGNTVVSTTTSQTTITDTATPQQTTSSAYYLVENVPREALSVTGGVLESVQTSSSSSSGMYRGGRGGAGNREFAKAMAEEQARTKERAREAAVRKQFDEARVGDSVAKPAKALVRDS